MTSLIVAGLSIAGVAYAGRLAINLSKKINWNQVQKAMPSIADISINAYYKGGFEQKMSKREASLILGVSPSANLQRIRDSHRRIMIVNHPDKGGSPYLASKINEAKDILEGKTKSN
ncbi:dnaJ homolog subfamily C member 15 isoform X2 [Hydra vulgaris]|uniref:DnaJ homolog subfamily C member 15 isoform X2 n=1 Tax=Hydra vulgaris TaxID=6087 RepID=A0ABM4D5G3_HYDVU